MTQKVSCKDCMFYRSIESKGECLRNAPQPRIGVRTPYDIDREVSWPIVRQDDLCGEFRDVGHQ